ncbi:hypothetical protein [Treponema sp.]|uniref:hypothetical protein n=1 Tax=Treponema sp. TaxID=166 RepID=UPI003890C37A
MSNDVLSVLPQSVTSSNAESSAQSALMSWKGASASWEQKTCDSVGAASVEFAVKWNNAIIPEIDSKIKKLESDYESKKAKHDEAYSQYKDKEREAEKYDKEIDDIRFEKLHHIELKDGLGFAPEAAEKGPDGMPRVDWKIVNAPAFYAADKREKIALSEQSECKKQAAKFETEAKSWSKQMDAVEAEMKKVKKEKEALVKKIETFILDVYHLNLMNESVAFLTAVKNSPIDFSSSTKKLLSSRLFFIKNAYRKTFDAFEKTIKAGADTYSGCTFALAENQISYKAERHVEINKFKGVLQISLFSDSQSSAKYSISSKNDFLMTGKDIEAAKQNVQGAFKTFELSTNRANFTASLNKNYENDAVESEIEKLSETSEAYAKELSEILEVMKANGATNSKIRILIGKVMNWHLDHWPKLWYKIASIAAVLILLVGVFAGTIAGINNAVKNAEYKKMFAEWNVTTDKKSKEMTSARRNIALSDTQLRYVYVTIYQENEAMQIAEENKSFSLKKPEKFIPFDEEYESFIRQSLAGILPQSSVTYLYFFVREYEGEIYKRESKKKRKGNSYGCIICVETDQDGSVKTMTDISGCGLRTR